MPLSLGLAAWQAARYAELDKEVRRLEALQEDWVESNKRLIAGISALSSSGRIERVAVDELGLMKIRPERVLQVRIARPAAAGAK